MPYNKSFEKLVESTRKTYLGKEVPKKYKKKYKNIYDKEETKSIAFAIAKSRGIKIE